MYIATFQLHTASLHQVMRSTGYAKTYKPLCSAVISWFSTAVISAFRSSQLFSQRFAFSQTSQSQPSIVVYKVSRNQSTSSPEED